MKREIVGASVVIALGLVPGTLSPVLAEMPLMTAGGTFEAPRQSGRGMTGRVTYSGLPEEKRFKFSNYPNSRFCREGAPSELVDGDFRMLRTIEVGVDRGLKGAIVAVTDILDLRFMAEYPGTDVVVENCSFSLFTGVIVKRRSFRVENRDADRNDPKAVKGTLHSAHTFEVQGSARKTIFNILLPEKGLRSDKPVRLHKDGSHVWLVCDFHESEQAFFLPVTNPYYAKVADDGSFEIKGVPPGRHRIVAWHPFAGQAEADIFVDELGSAQVNFELRKGEWGP
jgi:hypothetical protein